MEPAKLLSRENLKNGLTLEFWDRSQPLTGDRWQAVVEIRVPVALTPETLPPELRPQGDRVSAALGPVVVFIKQEGRIFVAAGEIPALVAQLQEQLRSSLAAYLAHPEFAPRFIRKKFADYQERKKRRQ
ncbi:MAG: hypothetical protein PHU44_16555 [Syntrophales bacterium]|nr:hypothetical protein [Syntrophales bacterium]MDD5643142.1 hypothetical protein [Syntrophales bacterium]